MPRIDVNPLLNFDVGISGIARPGPASVLPDEGAAPALDTRPPQHFEQLFSAQTADGRMLASLAPAIADPEILEPAAYAAALEATRTLLAELVACVPAADQPALTGALAVLDRQQADRAFLEAARRALMRA